MLESHLVEGKQNISDNMVYGQSITDACISFEDTVGLLESMAKSL
jgi:3-deoxy-7-phosphoheptulonate synthase